jgi:chromatin assembly factor 1 subunit B
MCYNRSSDGQTLLLSSRDGYCTIVIFDEILLASHTQQHALQLQSIAHQNSVPLVSSTSATSTPATSTIGLPHLHTHSLTPSSHARKRSERSEPPLTPAASTDGESTTAGSFNSYFNPGTSASGSGNMATPTAGSSTAGAMASFSASIASPKLVDISGKSDTSEGHKRQVSGMGSNVDETDVDSGNTEQPPKKKRRVALTRVGDLDS